MLFFSATFEDSVWKFAERIIPDPNIIRLKREEETLDNIRQFYIICKSKEEKFSALCNLYGCLTIAQTIVFCHVSLPSMTKGCCHEADPGNGESRRAGWPPGWLRT